MYIKSIVIDGFKSYAQRTEINGFDPQFNAITGLNGSGKSNILDSICFLLGISKLEQVRASNLQELVYKSGQAGVTRATVSITFDNSDSKNGPVGYENLSELTVTRQVVIGGRNKYLINGCNATSQRIQDLFGSVQLNVNNPHFLIMQGRITKVLNMKPPEILSMIEEAAGTRLYENKKQSVQRTIEKKDSKLKEIETVLNEEITPTLEKLKEERASYLEFQKVIRELEHLTRLYVAYQFVTAEEMSSRSAKDLEEMNQSMQKLRDAIAESESKIKEIDEAIAELEKKRNEEAGSTLKQLEKKVDELSKIDVKANSDVKHMKEQITAEKRKTKELDKAYNEDNSQIVNKEKELVKLGDLLVKLEEKSNTDTEAVKTAQEHFHAVSAGLSSNDDGEDKTLADQIMTCKNEISNAETQSKQAQMKLKHSESELSKKQKELKSTEQGYKKDKDAFDALQKQKAKIQGEMEKCGYVDGTEEQLIASRKSLEKEVNQLGIEVDNLEAKYPALNFEYSDPEPGFDRRKVKGIIAQLAKVKDPKTATALEASAGGKLQHIVVDNEVTGKKLLKNGALKKRVTIIPLTKIQYSTVSAAKVKRAEELVGKNNVFTALSLVECDKEFEAAIKYAFGGTLICTNMDVAKKVAFDSQVMTRTVTLDGDIFDPSGTLTGGARQKAGSLLAKAQMLVSSKEKLMVKRGELDKVMKDLNNCKKQAEKFKTLKNQLELKSHEAELFEGRLKQTTHHQQLEEIAGLQQGIDEQKEVMKNSKETIKKNEARCKEIETKMKEAKTHREQELKRAEEGLSKAKKKAEESSKLTKTKQQEVEGLKLEVEQLKTELANSKDQKEKVESSITNMQEQLEKLTETAQEAKDKCKEAEAELKKQKDALKACTEAIEEKAKEKGKQNKEISSVQLQIKELEHKISKHEKDSKDASSKVESMLRKYEWIETERQYFGQANTAYDFASENMKEVSRNLTKLEGTKAKLAKNVNMRAMNMLDKAEEKYNDLMRKKQIVENDKEKIEAVIRELDEKKKQALKTAWEQVNKDFGSIFSTLLPGTTAKLAPAEGTNFLDGLEVKVAFGTVWKESLNELSGGQRSLVALSLILSLLLFKPAPLYILDEIDAALDLSHTQNIGQMLRAHFKHSQFIVVSLKDGMFTNANVLFKTKFVDGTSTVARHVQRSGKKD